MRNLNSTTFDTDSIISGSQTWKQTFTIDRYGNRRFDAANTTTLGSCTQVICNPTISTANNRFSSGQGYGYDQNGNVTQDAEGKRFGYDAESRQKEFFAAGNASSTPDAVYSYDGEGKRVKKISSTETTVFVYNASGQLVAEYSTQTAQTQQVSYLTTDHLGSPRVITDQNGAVTSRKDFGAFGDETITPQRTAGLKYQPDSIRQDYTGYQRDAESGLEYAQARYYNPTHGRFTSVDPLTASATIKSPQTFNRYSYVLNSPYKFTDPLGLLSSSTSACGQWCANGEGSLIGGGGGDSGYRDITSNFLPESVTIDLNIVYDAEQYTLQQAQTAVKATLDDLQSSYKEIAVLFNVTFAAGKADSSNLNKDGMPTKILTGAKDKAINVFLFASNKFNNGKGGSYYQADSKQMFVVEGSFDQNPRSSNVGYNFRAGALAHEVGHLFLDFAGVSMQPTRTNNLSQDGGIEYALGQTRYNPFYYRDSELPIDYNLSQMRPGSALYARGSAAYPTTEQLLRLGARRVAFQ